MNCPEIKNQERLDPPLVDYCREIINQCIR